LSSRRSQADQQACLLGHVRPRAVHAIGWFCARNIGARHALWWEHLRKQASATSRASRHARQEPVMTLQQKASLQFSASLGASIGVGMAVQRSAAESMGFLPSLAVCAMAAALVSLATAWMIGRIVRTDAAPMAEKR
jgi:hypothetical protein